MTSSQSLNLSNLTLWFAFLFKAGVPALAAAVSLRCVRISGLNLVKTCQAQVGDKRNKNAAVTQMPLRSNLLDNAGQHKPAVGREFQSLSPSYSNMASF